MLNNVTVYFRLYHATHEFTINFFEISKEDLHKLLKQLAPLVNCECCLPSAKSEEGSDFEITAICDGEVTITEYTAWNKEVRLAIYEWIKTNKLTCEYELDENNLLTIRCPKIFITQQIHLGNVASQLDALTQSVTWEIAFA